MVVQPTYRPAYCLSPVAVPDGDPLLHDPLTDKNHWHDVNDPFSSWDFL